MSRRSFVTSVSVSESEPRVVSRRSSVTSASTCVRNSSVVSAFCLSRSIALQDLDLGDQPRLASMIEYVAMNLNVLWRYFFLAGYLKARS